MTDTRPTFPQAGLNFLKSLKRNNNREWFQRHKAVYEESVKLPMIRLIEALAEEFAEFAPEILVSPKSLFRIYRDTRFSKDKRPYPAGHPAGDYLRFKDLLAARELEPAEATKPNFLAILVESFQGMHPFIRFLNEPILRRRQERDRHERFFTSVRRPSSGRR